MECSLHVYETAEFLFKCGGRYVILYIISKAIYYPYYECEQTISSFVASTEVSYQ
jgi:hypothetical protein